MTATQASEVARFLIEHSPFDRLERGDVERLAAAAEVEELHGIRVEVVRTGDAPLDGRCRVLVLERPLLGHVLDREDRPFG